MATAMGWMQVTAILPVSMATTTTMKMMATPRVLTGASGAGAPNLRVDPVQAPVALPRPTNMALATLQAMTDPGGRGNVKARGQAN